jgi:xylulokinase
MSYYLIGIDIGTQGTKAVLFDMRMGIVAEAFEASRLISPKPGTVWQEAEDIYLSCARTAAQIIEKSDIDPARVAAIGIDGQMAGIMGIDEEGEACTYYDSWLDMRCGKYMQYMRKKAGNRVVEITGGPVTYTHGPKILWWKNEHPEAYKKTCKFVLPHGYVAGKMTGLAGAEAVFDYTCIQYSGFGDNLKKEWSDELLELFGVGREKMARIVSPFEVIGKTNGEFAQLSGLPEGIPVVAGAGDTAASVFGSGMFESGTILDCAGTASVFCCVVDAFQADVENQTMTMMRSPVDGYFMPLSYINGGGLCVRWFRDELSGKPAASYDQLESEAKEVVPGSEGILFVPHFGGRVLPNNPYVKGSFVGLDWKHTRGHMYRAVMEGIAYEYGYYFDVLKKLYPNTAFRQMYSIGGGAKSDLFNSIKSDMLGLPVTTYRMGDTALVGSAVIAGFGAGVFDDYKKPVLKFARTGKTFEPNMENHRTYKKYAAQYLDVIGALEKVYKSEIYGIE